MDSELKNMKKTILVMAGILALGWAVVQGQT